MASTDIVEMYIYDLPLQDRSELCSHLNQEDNWKKLAKEMDYREIDMNDMARNKENPADEFLSSMGDYNHTVLELYMLLYRLKLHSAMGVISKFVPYDYQRLIPEARPDITGLLRFPELKRIRSRRPSESNENNESVIYNKEAVPEIHYGELLIATNNWHQNNILGKGGFGVVYKGEWKYSPVAIKRLIRKEESGKFQDKKRKEDENKREMQQSRAEMKHLNNLRQDNILPIYGFSYAPDGTICLVYQYMPNGSLDMRLNDSRKTTNFNSEMFLNWRTRKNIAIGTARGLLFLHTAQKPLIHGDIKPGNILLDSCFMPKIGDFGLAREGNFEHDESMKVSRVFGTRPYLPKEFIDQQKLSTKVDVFSYGVVLFELLTNEQAYLSKRNEPLLYNYVNSIYNFNPGDEGRNLVHVKLREDALDECKAVLRLGLDCTSAGSSERPEMLTVYQRLTSL